MDKRHTAKPKIIFDANKHNVVNWFQDYVLFGVDKSFFTTDDVMSKFKESSDLSHELTVWKLKTQEQEDILFFSKKNVNIKPDNELAFKSFLYENMENPEYKNKFVVFINGRFAGVDESESKLVEKIYNDLGNIEMFVCKVTLEEKEDIIDTPYELE